MRGRFWRSPGVWAALLILAGVLSAVLYAVVVWWPKEEETWDSLLEGHFRSVEVGERAWSGPVEGWANDFSLEGETVCADLRLVNSGEESISVGSITLVPWQSLTSLTFESIKEELGAIPLLDPTFRADALLPGGVLEQEACWDVGGFHEGRYRIDIDSGVGAFSWWFVL